MPKNTKIFILIFLVVIQIQLFQSAMVSGVLADRGITPPSFDFGVLGVIVLFLITMLVQYQILKVANLDTKK